MPASNRQPSQEKHGPHCTCPDCVGSYEHRVAVAKQLCAMCKISYSGLQASMTLFGLIRAEIYDSFNPSQVKRIRDIRQNTPTYFEQLLRELLD